MSMYTQHNPFEGWMERGNLPPSVFGALPYPDAPQSSDLITFQLTSFNPNVLNCVVIGRRSQTFFHVVTDANMPGYTVFKDAKGKNIALIEWQAHPLIELRGVIAKQSVKDWLRLSPDRCSRIMDIRGARYTWAPRDKSIDLYGANSTCLARITRGHGNIMLELIPDAIQLGLLEPIVVAALLLQCGRNID